MYKTNDFFSKYIQKYFEWDISFILDNNISQTIGKFLNFVTFRPEF